MFFDKRNLFSSKGAPSVTGAALWLEVVEVRQPYGRGPPQAHPCKTRVWVPFWPQSVASRAPVGSVATTVGTASLRSAFG